ncbi:MAG TPA: SDR family oxidoreductase [Polyangiaceae bacterium]|jgi:3-oxoacyl-[acyl-carrier protein] reductase
MSKLVYVTGAGRGIGRQIAIDLVASGYTVTGCARTAAELEETKKLAGGKLHTALVDVTDGAAIDAWLTSAASATGATPWGLVTAAGVYGPIGRFFDNAWDEWKKGIEINLYGTVLACRGFAKMLVGAKTPGRIVLLSGGGATQPLPRFTNYCASKAAVVRFGETIAHELAADGITVNAVAPGAVNTQLTDELLAAGPERAGADMYAKAQKQKESGGTSPTKGAELTKFLLSEEAAGITGRLLSAVWDPWADLPKAREPLAASDIYTLRRIVPEDRPKVPFDEKLKG